MATHNNAERAKNDTDFVRPKPTLYMGGTGHWKDDEIEDIIRSSVCPKQKFEMPSISNSTKKAKDGLEADPYNIERIVDLGFAYTSEVQYDKAANVLIRGWKRSSELKNPSDRFDFLMKLCEVSFRNHYFRQAHAVLMDIEEPEDYCQKKAFQLLSVHIFAEMNDSPKALSVFSKAIEKEEFEMAVKIWAACAIRLKKAGANEVAKTAVLAKARSGQNHFMDQSRIQTVESWALMGSDVQNKKGWFDLEDGIPKWMLKAAAAFFAFLLIWFLYYLETRSLRSMKML